MTQEQNPKPESTPVSKSQNWSQQLIGIIVGGLLSFFVLQLVVLLFGWQPANPNTWILLGAALGGMLNDLARFDKAGSRLTGRNSEGNPRIVTLNVVVALLGAVVLLLILFAFMSLANLLFGKWIN